MVRFIVFSFLLIANIACAQYYENYNPSKTLKTQLIHTKLKVSFDFEKEHLLGEEWLTARPYYYDTDSLILDAKAMLIHEVAMMGQGEKKTPLQYAYNGNILGIYLGKTFTRKENYTVYIKYTARPNEVKQTGSAAIRQAKGLYFINPRGEEPDKPTQIWTQGETESSSCWFPTIDSPNQKTSQEIYITVPDRFVTLSNGILVNQIKDGKGNRTDYWKFEKKHAPYLFFMAVGDFAIVKDKWKNIPVDYYVEHDYKDDAMGIFGQTPAMIDFFSEILKYPFPWEKYHQIVCRDFVSGAMENTTAVIHSEMAHQKAGQLIDENIWEDVIAHELFHHWFGDLVTTESWANLTVNESFANYSEYLWREFKYGKDHAEAHKFKDIQEYLLGDNFNKHLVRFDFGEKEDMFDNVSYNKGGYILHMLRKYLGDDAFFDGLNLYLKQNEYKAAEAHHLRLALEEVSGKDLNWFFNQWYFSYGHPKIKFGYQPMVGSNKVKITLRQTQGEKYFQFPFAIDVYTSKGVKRHQVWAKAVELNEFELPYDGELMLVNPNADHVLLCEIEQTRTIDQMIHLLKNSKEYMDRKEAIEALATTHIKSSAAQDALIAAMKDPYYGLRVLAIKSLNVKYPEIFNKAKATLEDLALKDPKTLVQAAAIQALKNANAKEYVEVFKKGLESKSFAVFGNSLSGLYSVDKAAAKAILESIDLKYYSSEELKAQLSEIIIQEKMESKIDFIASSVAFYKFATFQDPKLGKVLKQGFEWIMGGDYEKATQIVANELAKLYPQVKQYGVGGMLRDSVNEGIKLKKNAISSGGNKTNLEKQIKMLENALGKMKD